MCIRDRHYLTKPVDVDAIEAAFHRDVGDETVLPSQECRSVGRVAWEHIQGVLAEHGGNVTASARALGMHRRTLQRKLFKFPAKRWLAPMKAGRSAGSEAGQA